MLQGWPFTVGAGVALLLLGILLGRAWILLRFFRRERSRYGDHPHYLLGLNYLISNQPDLALVELSKAVRGETDAVEAYLALGNLFREKGQVERAIDIHKSLLHRPNLTELGRLQSLFSLGLDFKKAGLIDRAERTLREVVKRDPHNLSGWHCLRKVYEEMGRWDDAAEIQRKVQSLAGTRDDRMMASLWTERGRAAWGDGDLETALANFTTALELDADYAPAHLGAGDCFAERGEIEAAVRHWQEALSDSPAWATEALSRIAEAGGASDDLALVERACAQVLERQPHSWRAQLIKSRLHRRRGDLQQANEALTLALSERPGSLTVQRELWESLRDRDVDSSEFNSLLDRVMKEARLVDPYVCLRCGFKSSEPFARCPHCQEWNTVAEEQA
ncbi:MAG: tetratricopeptide repeat protein [Acidobacteriota bacterium]